MTDGDTSLALFLNDVECASSIFAFEIVDEEQKELKIHVAGVNSTPYAGGMYEIVFNFPVNYPEGIPTAKFQTAIWNSAVNPENQSVHFEDTPKWNVVNALTFVEDSIQKIDVCEFSTFYRIARFWAAEYAGAPKSPEDPHLRGNLDQLVSMGFTEPNVIMALSNTGWDAELALEELIKAADDDDW
ncbi:unnamed protein product [Caenorhabditis nigoni]